VLSNAFRGVSLYLPLTSKLSFTVPECQTVLFFESREDFPLAITKAHLKEATRTRLPMSNSRASQLVESLLETMKKSLAAGEDILISGIGKFSGLEKSQEREELPR
jgi:hypothetical protein